MGTNSLLIAAAVFACVAGLISPELPGRLESPQGIVDLFSIVSLGYAAALAIHKAVERSGIQVTQPWYNNGWAAPVLLVSLPCTGALLNRVDGVTLGLLGITSAGSPQGRSFAFMAVELVSMVLVESRRRNGRRHIEPPWRRVFRREPQWNNIPQGQASVESEEPQFHDIPPN